MTLSDANRRTAQLAGYTARRHDGEPGAESLAIGHRRLMDHARGWRLHREYS